MNRSLAKVASIRANTTAKFPAQIINEVGFMRLDTELVLEVAPSFVSSRTVVVLNLLVQQKQDNGVVPMVVTNLLDKDLYIREGTWLASVIPAGTVSPLQEMEEEPPIMSATDACDKSPELDSTPPCSSSILPPHLEPMVTGVGGVLSDKQKWEVEEFVSSEADMFVGPNVKVGRTHLVKHHIPVNKKVRAIKQRTRRLPRKKETFVEQEIKHLQDEDMIEEADGPWASPIVIVKKGNGEDTFLELKTVWRACLVQNVSVLLTWQQGTTRLS